MRLLEKAERMSGEIKHENVPTTREKLRAKKKENLSHIKGPERARSLEPQIDNPANGTFDRATATRDMKRLKVGILHTGLIGLEKRMPLSESFGFASASTKALNVGLQGINVTIPEKSKPFLFKVLLLLFIFRNIASQNSKLLFGMGKIENLMNLGHIKLETLAQVSDTRPYPRSTIARKNDTLGIN